MDNRYPNQGQQKIQDKLALENIRRVLFTSFVSLFVIPLLMLVNKFFNTSRIASTYNEVLIVFEGFSAMSVIMSYTLMRKRDAMMSRFVYRTYWLIFEVFSLAVVYADSISGGKFTFYAVMLAVMTLAPVMSGAEQLYYMVLQFVYAVFAVIKFDTVATDAVNLFLVNGTFITASRLLYADMVGKLTVREQMRTTREAAAVDEMTGLMTKESFDKEVDSHIEPAIESKIRMSLIMLDIDELGAYNSAFGNDKGDDCIRIVAETVKQIGVRSAGMACRLEGGRFLIYMEGGSDLDPVKIAEKLRKVIADKRIAQSKRACGRYMTVSLGVASCIPRSDDEFRELYEEVEEALAGAKEEGRNLTVYDEQVYGSYDRRAN